MPSKKYPKENSSFWKSVLSNRFLLVSCYTFCSKSHPQVIDFLFSICMVAYHCICIFDPQDISSFAYVAASRPIGTFSSCT